MAKDIKETIKIPPEMKADIEKMSNKLNISKNDVYKILINIGLKFC